ncbi:Zinc finger CCCH domain-containing protein 30 [Glycine soja]|uniref:Zinc finger CCCH domain-containing protein 30 n=1 Tax=Glycine soja TaxID=3848 RepID=A0A445H2Z2_GLYSO|nr:Zinc finger CCCH domain-containing protein 30 [Glycine soja]
MALHCKFLFGSIGFREGILSIFKLNDRHCLHLFFFQFANNDIEGFKGLSEKDFSSINEVGLWYGQQNGSKQFVLEHKTYLMVAATYGSINVMKIILLYPEADVDFGVWGQQKHCPVFAYKVFD